MKIFIKSFIFLIPLLFTGYVAEAQLLKKINDRVKQTAEDKVVNKAGEATDKTLDKAEESAKKKKKGKTEDTDAGKAAVADNDNGQAKSQEKPGTAATLQSFKNYDFVPGDKIIFYYDMADEADAEIPGRMLINAGNAEVQTYKEEKVLVVPAGGNVAMKPFMKEDAYLPEQFTFEFDMLSNGGIETTIDVSDITLYFREKGHSEGSATAPVRVTLSGVSGDASGSQYEFATYSDSRGWLGKKKKNFPAAALNATQNNWRRVAVYVNKNISKLYVDQHRLGVVNQVEPGVPAKLEIEVANSEHPVMFKNFRIAAGGTDAYKKVMTDGKFIAYGIQFDVNKATLKPESMGTINEFVKMMKANTGLKFEVGGHTDADGTAQRNDKLSQERADAVKAQMVSMGIDAGRLSTRGFGSSQPIVQNDNAENKAKNRRVEFVKQ